MSQKTDVTGGARQSGVLLQDLGILYVVQVGIHQYRAVQRDANVAAVNEDLFLVPLAGRLLAALFRRTTS